MTPSPPPDFNFLRLPVVTTRDAFWHQKHEGAGKLEEIDETFSMPKPSSTGPVVGILAAAWGFAMVWHIWWIAIVAAVGMIAWFIARSFVPRASLHAQFNPSDLIKHPVTGPSA